MGEESNVTELTDAAREHVLLTLLGMNPQEARYRIENKTVDATLAPIALFELLPEADRPDWILALCTPEAKGASLPILEDGLSGQCVVKPVDIPAGNSQANVHSFLATVAAAIPERADLTVDVTHGFRHFSFLTYVAVLYVSALRGIRIRGAYYGMLSRNDVSPFLDLRPLLELPRWLHALQVLKDTGSAASIARILNDGSQGQASRRIAKRLSQFSEAYLSGLPLELGRHADEFEQQSMKPLKKLLQKDHALPLGNELADQLAGFLKPLALGSQVSGSGWKQKMALSKEELERQAAVIDNLLRHGSVTAALGLMNEWTVSWVIWVRAERKSEWLDYRKVRRDAASRLGAIRAIGNDSELCSLLTKEQRLLGAFWRKLSDLRNGYHHHGMRPQVLIGDAQTENELQCVREYWTTTLRSCPENFRFSLGDSSGGQVLVSPIGMRPGVLYSALHACKGDNSKNMLSHCLVICSPETQGRIDEAVEHAGYKGPVEPLVIEDAFGGGSGEIHSVVARGRKHIIGAEAVFVNVTGGTTLMGLAAEALASAGRELACPVRRFGMIDRRPPREQEDDPYRAGEPFWLDAGEDKDAN